MQNSIISVVGARGKGKTKYVLGDPELGLPGIIPLYPKNGLGVLIMCTIDHPTYREAGIPIMEADQFDRWKGQGVYRIIMEDPKEWFELISKQVENALVVWEDATEYIDQYVDKTIKNLCIHSKQRNVDVLFMFHGFGYVPKSLFRLVNDYVIFKQTDNLDKSRTPSGVYNAVQPVFERVMAHPDLYHNESVTVL